MTMSSIGGKFGKFDKIVQRIEFLTEEVVKNQFDQDLKKQLKKAEEGLYRMIEKEQKSIDRLLASLNQEEEEWEE
jgi:hypothetical protein